MRRYYSNDSSILLGMVNEMELWRELQIKLHRLTKSQFWLILNDSVLLK